MGMVGGGEGLKEQREMTRKRLCRTNLVVGWGDQAGVRTEVHAVGVQTEGYK